MNTIKTEHTNGIVNASYFHKHFSLQRFYPSKKLSDLVEHYWLVNWHLPHGESYTQSVIPHPNTHLTIMENASHIQGVCQSKYNHTMVGNGEVLGVKFKPAGFFPFATMANVSMNTLLNNKKEISDFFSLKYSLNKIETCLLNTKQVSEKIEVLESLLFFDYLDKQTNVDEKICLINTMVNTIATKKIMSVNELCEQYQVELRTLQRLFNQYVGVSAKWIINRYRMHEALTKIESAKQFDWTQLALDLGYFDQAHFIKDFKKLIGVTPKQHHTTLLA